VSYPKLVLVTPTYHIAVTETLRRAAEDTMHALVRTVFSRLCTLDPETEEEKLRGADEVTAEGEIKMTVSSPKLPPESGPIPLQEITAENPPEPEATVKEPTSPQANRPHCTTHYISCRRLTIMATTDGLPSIFELLRVLINVLDPNDKQHTDSTRLIALGILNAALEESGHHIAHYPSLESLIVDPGCKFLFQLARSDNISVLHLALRTISTVFETIREHLKLQQELFLAFTIDRLALSNNGTAKRQQGVVTSSKKPYSGSPRPGTPATSSPKVPLLEAESDSEKAYATPSRILVAPARGETRQSILEALSQLSRHPSFMVDLYVNYDCDINCENLFERLIDFLTKVVILPSALCIN